MNLPLEGIKVLDCSMLLPGPLCSMYMGDLGAEVIKIENPKTGDFIRNSGKKIISKDGNYSISSLYLMLNRNKKSLSLNLLRKKGQEIFLELVKQSDVIIDGFRPGKLNELGIGYEQCKKANSKIIFCGIYGYGTTGPYSQMAGHDGNYLANAGVLGVNTSQDGQPVLPGFQLADIGGGSYIALSSILLALYQREKTNLGQFLDVSMMDGAFSFLNLISSDYSYAKYKKEKYTQKPNDFILSGRLPNYSIYKTKDDRYIAVCALEDIFFKNFLKQINRSEILEKFPFLEKNFEAIHEEVQQEIQKKTATEWNNLFKNENSCVSLVKSIEEAFLDPQLNARNMIFTIQHPKIGEFSTIHSPFPFSKTSKNTYLPPPDLGEHTKEVLERIGYMETDLEELKSGKII